MNTEFECLECRHKFNADKNTYVSCPNCGTDNVTPVGKNFLKYILFVLIFAVSAVAGYFTFRENSQPAPKQNIVSSESAYENIIEYNGENYPSEEFGKIDNDVENPEVPFSDDIIADSISSDTIISENDDVFKKETVALEIEVPEPKYVQESKSYSFSASCCNAPAGLELLWYLVAYDDETNVIAESHTGEFDGVAPSSNDGKYILIVLGENNEYECFGSREIEGFNEVKEEAKPVPLTLQEVQKCIDNDAVRDMNVRNGKIMNQLSIKVLEWGDELPEEEFNSLDDLVYYRNIYECSIVVRDYRYNDYGTVIRIDVAITQ